MKDFEQLYYDLKYENEELKKKIEELEEFIKYSNKGDLKFYLINQINKYNKGK